MHALEYKKLRQKFLGTQEQAAKILGCSVAGISDRERCRDRETVTQTAELALLRVVAAKLLGKEMLTPAPKAKRSASHTKSAASKVKLTAAPSTRSQLVQQALQPFRCEWIDPHSSARCARQPGTPDRLYCPAHEPTATFMGQPIFRGAAARS